MSIDGYSAALDVGAHLEKRINELAAQMGPTSDYALALEQRVRDLESQVRSLFQVTDALESRLRNHDGSRQDIRHRVERLEDGDDEGVVTLRIRVERGQS